MKGVIVQVMGAVVDVQFPSEYLPSIYEALHVQTKFTDSGILVLEVASQIGDHRVKTVALGPTDGLKRGTEVSATGAPITVPVGKKTLGRLFNVVGNTIDQKGEVKNEYY